MMMQRRTMLSGCRILSDEDDNTGNNGAPGTQDPDDFVTGCCITSTIQNENIRGPRAFSPDFE